MLKNYIGFESQSSLRKITELKELLNHVQVIAFFVEAPSLLGIVGKFFRVSIFIPLHWKSEISGKREISRAFKSGSESSKKWE